jgi:hypothetical protein
MTTREPTLSEQDRERIDALGNKYAEAVAVLFIERRAVYGWYE